MRRGRARPPPAAASASSAALAFAGLSCRYRTSVSSTTKSGLAAAAAGARRGRPPPPPRLVGLARVAGGEQLRRERRIDLWRRRRRRRRRPPPPPNDRPNAGLLLPRNRLGRPPLPVLVVGKRGGGVGGLAVQPQVDKKAVEVGLGKRRPPQRLEAEVPKLRGRHKLVVCIHRVGRAADGQRAGAAGAGAGPPRHPPRARRRLLCLVSLVGERVEVGTPPRRRPERRDVVGAHARRLDGDAHEAAAARDGRVGDARVGLDGGDRVPRGPPPHLDRVRVGRQRVAAVGVELERHDRRRVAVVLDEPRRRGPQVKEEHVAAARADADGQAVGRVKAERRHRRRRRGGGVRAGARGRGNARLRERGGHVEAPGGAVAPRRARQRAGVPHFHNAAVAAKGDEVVDGVDSNDIVARRAVAAAAAAPTTPPPCGAPDRVRRGGINEPRSRLRRYASAPAAATHTSADGPWTAKSRPKRGTRTAKWAPDWEWSATRRSAVRRASLRQSPARD
ncbi:hypothetical protein BU14_0736s0003 [Porphyra umbilicalis]|uniref:Uncharacterized protein n=1 Tax=Porphyra umbilicalis TaxID=2786 RepID=A0A1X6NPQ6_PORUM|nr:hypothetical protein BU14_0736s0003 [Porphyra umbilicalis]|eukprot:OSX70510.1 hypothetical protein BU14_0736s0003 [Porphyra umbilicalis]